MLIILLGIILSIFLAYLLIWFTKIEPAIVAGIVGVVVIISLFIGMCAPVSGYTNWESAEQIELVWINNETAAESKDYVSIIVSTTQVTYKYKIEYGFESDFGADYITDIVEASKADTIESSDIVSPYLKIFKREGNMSIWTFAFGSSEEKYVFFVPEGTIKRN